MSSDTNAWLALRDVRWYAHVAIEQGDASPTLAMIKAKLDAAVLREPDVRGAFEALEAALARGSDKVLKRALNRARAAAGLPIRRQSKGRRTR